MPKSPIFLIGMPGCGKSTLAKTLATRFQVAFVDLDDQIQQAVGKTVTHLFESEGEDVFRKIEKNQLEKTIYERSTFIMATGGGTPCFFDNMEKILSAGLVVFIDVAPTELFKRLNQGTEMGKRPLLKHYGNHPLEELINKRINRMNFYTLAHLTICGDNITPEDLIKVIADHAD